jgi:hypothetical protein
MKETLCNSVDAKAIEVTTCNGTEYCLPSTNNAVRQSMALFGAIYMGQQVHVLEKLILSHNAHEELIFKDLQSDSVITS